MIPEIDFLKKVYIFQDLDDNEIEAVAGTLTPLFFKSDQVILKEGDEGGTMYIIATGVAQISKTLTMKFGQDDYRETEKTMTNLKAEDASVFGEMALITENERSASVTAVSECTLYGISREDFLKLAESNPGLGFKVMRRLAELISQRLKTTDEDVVRLTTALSIALSQ